VTGPHPTSIATAEAAAQKSPCAKSKRGVVVYSQPSSGLPFIHGVGFNGPPAPFSCTATNRCREICGKICVHAEMRAIRTIRGLDDLYGDLHLLHVKLGPDGHVVPGSGPSCWQCSREILDAGFIAGVWLCEARPLDAVEAWDRWYGGGEPQLPGEPSWRYYTAEEFHRQTLRSCGIEASP
jgi:deoxycytidylate deaminase